MRTASRWTRRRALAAAALLAGCAVTPPPPAKIEVPVYPPPPEPARFIYERSIYSSADVVRDAKRDAFRRFATGAARVGEGMSKPYAVAVQQGRVYVSDTVRRSVLLFDFSRGLFKEIGTQEPGMLRLPLGLDVDAAGNLYVADGTLKRVLVYGPDGSFLRQIGAPERLQRPAGLAVDRAGTRVYVVDIGGVESQAHGLRVIDAVGGQHLADIGRRGEGNGEFNLPRDVAISPDGLLYVVDGGNFRVQVLRPSGEFVRSFGSVGRQGGQFSRPKEIAIDRDGNVYVADAAFGNFQIFDAQGRLLLDIGGRSNADAPGQYMLPSGIDVDDDGRVYFVDQYFRKIDVFRPAHLPVTGGFLGAYADTSAEARRQARASRP